MPKVSFVKKGQALLLLSFALLVVIGTALLMLPGMLKTGSLPLIDAAFMACSAVCLTGLASVPVGDFTVTGQAVLLLLIQCGSIGIMALSAMILLIIGRGLSFSNTLMINNLNDGFSLRNTEFLIKTIIGYTFISEGIGFAMMFPGFLMENFGFWKSVWYSIYFSVGSFCNSGFSPLEGSMITLNRYIQSCSIVLMIAGGLGVYVVYDMIQCIHERHRHLRLHSRIVLWATVILVAAGTILLFILSKTDGESLSLFDAIFLSISSRTAGYCTTDPGMLSHSCQMVIIVLMLIGGSPGGTAGGIKTSTIAVAFAALSSSFKGDSCVILGKRTIATSCVLRAFTIIVIFVLTACAGAILLESLSPGGMNALKCFFESASAISTSGLSTGTATAEWNVPCKTVLILFMFAGRVGPLTVVLFFVGREKPERLRYPEEHIIVG